MKPLVFSLAIFVAVISCKETVQEEAGLKHPDEIVNPNGDSELAIAMRYFHYEANIVREAILNNEEPNIDTLMQLAASLKTAPATDEAVRDSAFMALSDAMIAQVSKIKGEQKQIEFKNMVALCVACHRNTCPGPITKILKLNEVN